jgi:hypothetical protein
MDDDETKKGCQVMGDELMAGPELPGGARPYIRHTADHKITSGIMRPVKEGEMLYDGAFQLEHKEGPIFKVSDVFDSKASAPVNKGPAKVATPAYRSNYDNIFGKKTATGQA